METSKPCSACSWTAEQQNDCSYHSHLKLFYGVSNRGVWSVGSRYVIKDRGDKPPNFDPQNLPFLQAATTIPVPTILDEWSEPGDVHFTIMRRIEGTTLKEAWPSLSGPERQRIARQTVDYLGQLRKLQSDRLQGLGGAPLYCVFLLGGDYGLPHGPFKSDDELWDAMAESLGKLSDGERHRLRQLMPPAAPYTFTHGDLAIQNIMVQGGNVTAILDWESSGYFPVWWEFVKLAIIDGPEDIEWKSVLRAEMTETQQHHTAADAFWREYYRSSR